MNRLNVTLIDLLYILSGLIGLLFSLRAIPAYHRSVRAAQRLHDPAERRDATQIHAGILVRECNRFTVHVLGGVVGCAALFIVPVGRVVSPYDHAFGILLDSVLLWANISATINTVLAWMEYCTIRERRWFAGVTPLALLRVRVAQRERPAAPHEEPRRAGGDDQC